MKLQRFPPYRATRSNVIARFENAMIACATRSDRNVRGYNNNATQGGFKKAGTLNGSKGTCAAGQKASKKSSAGGRKYVKANTMIGETISNASENVLKDWVGEVEGDEMLMFVIAFKKVFLLAVFAAPHNFARRPFQFPLGIQ
jgi:hypothetical protein